MKIILLTTVLLFLALCMRAQHRQPFTETPHSAFALRSPGQEPPNGDEGSGGFIGSDTGSSVGGPLVPPPNDDEGGGGFVGYTPVSDGWWMLSFMALGYGAFRRREFTPKSPKGDLSEQ